MKEVWYGIDTVPSGLRWYPEGTRLSLRPYSVRETLQLAKMKRTSDIIRHNLSGIKAEGIAPEELVLSDYYFLMLMRNGISGTLEGLLIKGHTCTECGKVFDHRVSLEEIEVEDLPESDQFELKLGEVHLVVSPLRVKHTLDPISLPETEELPFLKELVQAVESIQVGGEALTWKNLKEKVDLFLELPSQLLNDLYEGLLPKIFPQFKIDLPCPQCGAVGSTRIPLSAEEVKPFCRS